MNINATQSHSGEHLVAKKAVCNPEICIEKKSIAWSWYLFDLLISSTFAAVLLLCICLGLPIASMCLCTSLYIIFIHIVII